ncbi:MAG: hypothetical protein K9J74_08195 [Sulfuritalea sp.]|nr:hypothetical protein [Sulfuritalea sp.]
MATQITLPPGVTPTAWLFAKKSQLEDAQIALDILHSNETDADDKQRRQQVLFECEGALNRVKRMLLEGAGGRITLNPPDAELIARTQQLADQLDRQLLGERKFSAKLKLFTDISRMLTRMVGSPG